MLNTESSCLPPWFDTIIPETPQFNANKASSAEMYHKKLNIFSLSTDSQGFNKIVFFLIKVIDVNIKINM